MQTFDKIRNYYQQSDEWSRLDSPSGQLEKEEVMHLVQRFVPPRSNILDLGAGPGKYALSFAQLGYFIDLIDLSPRLIDIARERFAEYGLLDQVGSFSVGNAIDISHIESRKYEAVFCGGPFYHLVDPIDRRAAGDEIMRVTKPGGLVFIGLMPRFSGLAGMIHRAAHSPDQVTGNIFKEMGETGVFHNGDRQGFQEGYCPTMKEAKAFWSEIGLTDIEIFSTRSFMHQNEEHVLKIRDRDPELFNEIIQTHRKYRNSEAFVEAGGHALLIGKTPAE